MLKQFYWSFQVDFLLRTFRFLLAFPCESFLFYLFLPVHLIWRACEDAAPPPTRPCSPLGSPALFHTHLLHTRKHKHVNTAVSCNVIPEGLIYSLLCASVCPSMPVGVEVLLCTSIATLWSFIPQAELKVHSQLSHRPINKQRSRALDKEIVVLSVKMSFRCTLKPHVVYICNHLSYSFGSAKLLITIKKLHSAPLKPCIYIFVFVNITAKFKFWVTKIINDWKNKKRQGGIKKIIKW